MVTPGSSPALQSRPDLIGLRDQWARLGGRQLLSRQRLNLVGESVQLATGAIEVPFLQDLDRSPQLGQQPVCRARSDWQSLNVGDQLGEQVAGPDVVPDR